MPEHEEYDDLNISELKALLVEQERLLADMEEQLAFLLRSTGHHIGGAKRKKDEAKVREQRILVESLCAKIIRASSQEPQP